MSDLNRGPVGTTPATKKGGGTLKRSKASAPGVKGKTDDFPAGLKASDLGIQGFGSLPHERALLEDDVWIDEVENAEESSSYSFGWTTRKGLSDYKQESYERFHNEMNRKDGKSPVKNTRDLSNEMDDRDLQSDFPEEKSAAGKVNFSF